MEKVTCVGCGRQFSAFLEISDRIHKQPCPYCSTVYKPKEKK